MTWNFIHFKEIDSTSLEAKRRIQSEQARAHDVVYADIQTGGYGRRGRAWQSAVGNLLATIIIDKPSDLGQIPFIFGLALFDALKEYADETQILKLKWPNDLLMNEGKVAGVLLEVDGDYLTIGFGVNLAVAPQSDQPVATLEVTESALEVLDLVLKRFDTYKKIWQEQGFEPIRKIWLENAHGVGKNITARFSDGSEKSGIFENISHDGALVIRNDNETQHIPTADIFFRT